MSPITLTTRGVSFRTLLFYALALCGVVLFVAYVLFQARFMIEGPQITITSSNVASENGRLVTLEGTAQNIVRISLNGRQIYTDKYGNFKETVVLENGYTLSTLQAEDRYGRVTTETKEFVYNR
jgi:hypothetical protein